MQVLVTYKMNLDRVNVGRVILVLGSFSIVVHIALVNGVPLVVQLNVRCSFRVASMWFKLYFHMVSNMLVAHSILFWQFLLLVAVWRKDQAVRGAAQLPGEWQLQRCSCRRHAMRPPAQPSLPPLHLYFEKEGGATVLAVPRHWDLWASAPLLWAWRRARFGGGGALVWRHPIVAGYC
jgi:hypothetical protein